MLVLLSNLCIYLQFSSLFAPTDASKFEIRNQGVYEDYISRLITGLVDWTLNYHKTARKVQQIPCPPPPPARHPR